MLENNEKIWKEIFNKVDEACYEEGWNKKEIRKLLLRIKKLTEQKLDKKR